MISSADAFVNNSADVSNNRRLKPIFLSKRARESLPSSDPQGYYMMDNWNSHSKECFGCNHRSLPPFHGTITCDDSSQQESDDLNKLGYKNICDRIGRQCLGLLGNNHMSLYIGNAVVP